MVQVLDLDPELGSGIAEEQWETARHACRAKVLRAPRGAWSVPELAGERDDLIGLVIVEGLVCREVALRDRCMFELLGRGDVLQLPVAAGRPRLGSSITLTVASETVLVGLGRSFMCAAARWPSLLAAVHRRLEIQREHLAIQGLITHLPHAEDRLVLALWHLADRWGCATPEGTLLPLPLTHELLGQLTASRRPTVSLAVSALHSAGYVRRSDNGSWLLTPAADEKIEAIAATRKLSRVLGQTIAFRPGTAQLRHESRARREQARTAPSRSREVGSNRAMV